MQTQEFVEYLIDTLIPDLEANSQYETARDFDAAVKLILSYEMILKRTISVPLVEKALENYPALSEDIERVLRTEVLT